MPNAANGKNQETVKNILDILNLVLALKDAYMDIRNSLKNERKVSRRVKQMRSNLLAVLEADKNARNLGDAFEDGDHHEHGGHQPDLPFNKVDLP